MSNSPRKVRPVRAGDLVHVPANVTLFRDASFDYGLVGLKHFVTKIPKKALFIGAMGHNNDYCSIEYGGHSWNVHKKDITLLEF
jgi:hypothetical protein